MMARVAEWSELQLKRLITRKRQIKLVTDHRHRTSIDNSKCMLRVYCTHIRHDADNRCIHYV